MKLLFSVFDDSGNEIVIVTESKLGYVSVISTNLASTCWSNQDNIISGRLIDFVTRLKFEWTNVDLCNSDRHLFVSQKIDCWSFLLAFHVWLRTNLVEVDC